MAYELIGALPSQSTATAAADLRAAIEPMLTAAGWQQVDTFTDGAAISWHVWKNPAANNSSGVDFYVPIGASTNQLYLDLAEAYDSGAHTMNYYASKPDTQYGSANWLQDGTGRWANGAVAPRGASTFSSYHPVTVPTGVPYALSVTKERIVISASASPAKVVYVGTVVNATGNALDTSLFIGCTSAFPYRYSATGTASEWSTTRIPALAANTAAYSGCMILYDGMPMSAQQIEGDRARAAEICVIDNNYSSNPQSFRGWLRDMVTVNQGSPAIGDRLTVSLNGTTKTYAHFGYWAWVDIAA